MTKALIIYCHPRPESFNAAVRDKIMDVLTSAGAETRLTDLYAEGFSPLLTATELETYDNVEINQRPVDRYVRDVQWCDTLIFVYPTWWYGLPAMLKGWLDRVLLPGVAFQMPQGENDTIRPGLGHIKRLGVFTTCGASWWLTRLIGAPGKRTLLRGVGFLCAKNRRSVFAAHFLMDSSTESSRQRHLERVGRKVDRLIN